MVDQISTSILSLVQPATTSGRECFLSSLDIAGRRSPGSQTHKLVFDEPRAAEPSLSLRRALRYDCRFLEAAQRRP
jgi:hypothetical protein